MDAGTQTMIENRLRDVVAEICPAAQYIPKYNGIMIALAEGDKPAFFGGYFFYAKHASVEFSFGAGFNDPEGHLEGGGKYRRHVKLHRPEDVAAKNVKGFLAQALAQT